MLELVGHTQGMHVDPWVGILNGGVGGVLEAVADGPVFADAPVEADAAGELYGAADVVVAEDVFGMKRRP